MRNPKMSKLFATLLAAVFAAATVTPVIAQDKKDAPKAEAKKDDKAKGDAKKEDGKAKADAKKEDGKAKADDKKAGDKK
jgi:uncharacterized membrane protein YqiK